jgi:short-subunit dehydrogenase
VTYLHASKRTHSGACGAGRSARDTLARMRDRVVVITGASAGIGAALADQLGQAGAKLVLVARRQDALAAVAAKNRTADVVTVVADVGLRADVERARDVAIERFGHVDAWVNNVGRGITKPVSLLTDEDIDEMMRINVKSALYGVQAILPSFRAQGHGHILTVSSMLSRVPFAPLRSAYSAAKHALNALMANLRMELAVSDPGIHVSVVHPGVVDTEFARNAVHAQAEDGSDATDLPGAQSATEVAAVIAHTLLVPRADVYTRQGAQKMVVAYFSAPDMAVAERVYVK